MEDKKGVSVTDFKNWLSGVLDFQPEDWTPNAEQWKKILDKIEQLDETQHQHAPEVITQAQQPQRKRPHGPILEEGKSVGKTSGGTAPSNPVENVINGPSVKLPDLPEKQKHVRVEKAGAPSIVEDEGTGKRVISTGEVHKMGTIDTSDGTYKSSFV